ncbi:MAG: hypothetical protein ACJ71Z_08220 [Aeromicrobium sp.]
MFPETQSTDAAPADGDSKVNHAPNEHEGWHGLDRRFELLGAWSGVAWVIFAGAAYGISGLVPVKSPSLTPEQVASFVSDHHYRILIGMSLMLIGGFTFLLTWSLTLANQVRQYVNPSKMVFYVQVAVGLNGAFIGMFCGVFGLEMAYRADTFEPSTIQMLYDLLWFLFLTPWPPFMLWQFALGFAILSSTNNQRFLPRWIGYLSIWAGALEVFSLLSPFWYEGPFSYNGLVTFWIPGISFFVWVLIFAIFQVRNWKHVRDLPGGVFIERSAVR